MPVLQLDIESTYSSDYISNRYFIQADDISDGLAKGLVVAGLHRAILPTTFYVEAMRVSTPLEGDNLFGTQPLHLAGLRSVSSPIAPPFCRFRVDIQHGFKRPLRKYLLVPYTADMSGDELTSSAQSFVQSNYCAPLVDLGYIVDYQGAIIDSATVSPRVGMRQLRRGSKRKTQPII